MTARVSEAVARPVRTAGQIGAGAVLVEFYAAFWATDWTNRQYLAAVAFATLIVGAAQALVENRLGRGLLRQVPPRTAPVVDDTGHLTLEAALLLAVLAVLLVLLL